MGSTRLCQEPELCWETLPLSWAANADSFRLSTLLGPNKFWEVSDSTEAVPRWSRECKGKSCHRIDIPVHEICETCVSQAEVCGGRIAQTDLWGPLSPLGTLLAGQVVHWTFRLGRKFQSQHCPGDFRDTKRAPSQGDKEQSRPNTGKLFLD